MSATRKNGTMYRVAAALLILTLLASGFPRTVGYAAVSIPDKIRVALFLNLPSRNFVNITPAATLMSDGGMNIVWRGNGFTAPLGQAASGEPVRFAMDGYRAVVLETAELGAALNVLQKIQASSSGAFITQLQKSGKTVYQLSEGIYPSSSAAQAALEKWRAQGVASGVPAAANPKIAGPLGVLSGPYASREEAEAAAAHFGSLGMEAFVAVKIQDGAAAYMVRVGQEASAAGLDALRTSVAAAGGIGVQVPGQSEAYVVLRHDIYGSDNRLVQLYAIPAASGAVLQAQPAGSAPIRVAERFQRAYRGVMEMSVYADALAVVNEVGLEQYLYAVVGAEVGAEWPLEAQKAQAVAARSYALSSGTGFAIAHVVDTTLSQVYNGVGAENPNAIAAVDATAGEVLTHNGQIINAVFSSNAGGITADSRTEGWVNEVPYLAGGVRSPDDVAQAGLLDWYHVALPSGQRGYIRSDLLEDAGANDAGIRMMRVIEEGTNMRVRPKIETTAEPVARLSRGTLVVPLARVPENSAYSWVEDPSTPQELQASLGRYFSNLSGPVRTLEITKRGLSGRVTEVTVNGQPLTLPSPDSWRSALGGLRSTLIEVEETARMTLLGGGGKTRELPQQAGGIYVLGAGGDKRPMGESVFVMNASGQPRVVTGEPSFIFSVKGYGHGLGMSQYGAKGLAEQGNDYRYILQYYYKNATIEKGAGG